MKPCGYCGRENENDATHCKECGTSFIEALSAKLDDNTHIKTCFRWILLTLTIGGGFLGLEATVKGLIQREDTRLFFYLFQTVFIVLYLFTIIAGLLFADNQKRSTPLIIAWLLQIPWFSSPILSYDFSEGFHFVIGLANNGTANVFHCASNFGSEWHFSINQVDAAHPWEIGINLFAVIIFISLLKFKRSNFVVEK
jgi:hypothetical protein